MMKLDNKGVALASAIPLILSIAFFILVLPVLWNIFGFDPVSLPDGLLDFLAKVDYIYYLVGYFVPIDFIITCIVVILVVRNAHLFLSIIDYLMRKLGGN